ncbi:MAG: GNAT family N-acetyltransferase [Kofleriaceae bacterium]
MIRPATPDDAGFVSAIGVAAGMFTPEETDVTDAMMAAYFAGHQDAGHLCVIDAPAGERVAMAYLEPVRATEGTYELLMIAVTPAHQGAGRGAALLKHLEGWLAQQGQRLLLVQTSGEDDFARTRNFYLANGYRQCAKVADYYAPGVAMVMFRKSIGAGRPA